MARVETFGPSRVILNGESIGLTLEKFFCLCADNPELDLELTAQKEIVIMPPAGSEGSSWNFDITGQLAVWAKRDKTGIGFDSSGGFTLPNGAVRSPDAAWVRRERWEALSKEDRRKFAPVRPDFVIELRSPRNPLRELESKMEEYIANGADLGWLIDPYERKVSVYRRGRPPEYLEAPSSVSAEPVLNGFTLDLSDIWKTSAE